MQADEVTTTLSKDDRKSLAARGYENPAFFMRFFFPHWFPKKQPWFHYGILAILTRRCDFILEELTRKELSKLIRHFVYKDTNGKTVPIFHLSRGKLTMTVNRFILEMIPRGFSKTTLCNGFVIWAIEYNEHEHIVYVSEAALHSEAQLQNVKNEIEYNERLNAVFGSIVPIKSDPERWSQDMIQTTNGAVVTARGRGGQIRGLNINARRPDCIVLDDVEDKESVKTEEQRRKARQWFYGDVINALPSIHMKPNAMIVMLATLLHERALARTVSRDPQWNAIILEAIDLDGEPLWAEMMNHKDIDAKKISFSLAGELSTYYLEFHNTVRADETAKFRPEFIIHRPCPNWRDYMRALAIDPAISEKASASFCTIAAVGISPKGEISVLDVWGMRGVNPRQQVDMYFEFFTKWEPHQCGVESIAYQAALVHLLREEMFRKKKYFEIKSITHSKKKSDRILGILQPRYASGYVTHNRPFPMLETQLLDFRPDSDDDKDYPDVVAMAVSLLDPYAAAAGMDGKDLGDDELPPLDEVFEGDWRAAP